MEDAAVLSAIAAFLESKQLTNAATALRNELKQSLPADDPSTVPSSISEMDLLALMKAPLTSGTSLPDAPVAAADSPPHVMSDELQVLQDMTAANSACQDAPVQELKETAEPEAILEKLLQKLVSSPAFLTDERLNAQIEQVMNCDAFQKMVECTEADLKERSLSADSSDPAHMLSPASATALLTKGMRSPNYGTMLSATIGSDEEDGTGSSSAEYDEGSYAQFEDEEHEVEDEEDIKDPTNRGVHSVSVQKAHNYYSADMYDEEDEDDEEEEDEAEGEGEEVDEAVEEYENAEDDQEGYGRNKRLGNARDSVLNQQLENLHRQHYGMDSFDDDEDDNEAEAEGEGEGEEEEEGDAQEGYEGGHLLQNHKYSSSSSDHTASKYTNKMSTAAAKAFGHANIGMVSKDFSFRDLQASTPAHEAPVFGFTPEKGEAEEDDESVDEYVDDEDPGYYAHDLYEDEFVDSPSQLGSSPSIYQQYESRIIGRAFFPPSPRDVVALKPNQPEKQFSSVTDAEEELHQIGSDSDAQGGLSLHSISTQLLQMDNLAEELLQRYALNLEEYLNNSDAADIAALVNCLNLDDEMQREKIMAGLVRTQTARRQMRSYRTTQGTHDALNNNQEEEDEEEEEEEDNEEEDDDIEDEAQPQLLSQHGVDSAARSSPLAVAAAVAIDDKLRSPSAGSPTPPLTVTDIESTASIVPRPAFVHPPEPQHVPSPKTLLRKSPVDGSMESSSSVVVAEPLIPVVASTEIDPESGLELETIGTEIKRGTQPRPASQAWGEESVQQVVKPNHFVEGNQPADNDDDIDDEEEEEEEEEEEHDTLNTQEDDRHVGSEKVEDEDEEEEDEEIDEQEAETEPQRLARANRNEFANLSFKQLPVVNSTVTGTLQKLSGNIATAAVADTSSTSIHIHNAEYYDAQEDEEEEEEDENDDENSDQDTQQEDEEEEEDGEEEDVGTAGSPVFGGLSVSSPSQKSSHSWMQIPPASDDEIDRELREALQDTSRDGAPYTNTSMRSAHSGHSGNSETAGHGESVWENGDRRKSGGGISSILWGGGKPSVSQQQAESDFQNRKKDLARAKAKRRAEDKGKVIYEESGDGFYPVEYEDTVFDSFNLKVIYERDKTGFEESKEFPVEVNQVVAGRYQIVEYLGSAAFSKAIQCLDMVTGQMVCMKIIKNDKDFFDQSLDEIKLLKFINSNGDADEKNVLRLYDYFYHREHLFLVTELLRDNLYEFSKFNRESGEALYFTVGRLQRITMQCLTALDFIHSLKLIHCDLKPENILIRSYSRCEVKVIDFGSSCFIDDHLSSYVQSRSYRAPEVILGLPYDSKIDLWSLGCILAELWTGNVLFQNDSIQNLLSKISGIVGPFSDRVLSRGKYVSNYFTRDGIVYQEMPEEDTEEGVKRKRIQLLVPKRTSLKKRIRCDDAYFVDFLRCLLKVDPDERPTARQAMRHPWLTKCRYPENPM